GAFLHDLFRSGAFQGLTPKDAYFVKCDRATMTQQEIDDGVVNIVVGFAPLKPAEFVVIGIQQMTLPPAGAAPSRADPYRSFKFRVRWEGRLVAVAHSASGPEPSSGGVSFADLKISGFNKSTDITLKRGIISDPGFMQWIEAITGGGGAGWSRK